MAATASGDLMQTFRRRLTGSKLLFAIYRAAPAASGTYRAMPRRSRAYVRAARRCRHSPHRNTLL